MFIVADLVSLIACFGLLDRAQWDGSFEPPKHMFKLMDRKIFKILHLKILFI